MTVGSSVNVFNVLSDPSVTVDLEAKTCSCIWWQANGFPCTHVVASLKRSRLRVVDVVGPYFLVSSFRTSYSFPLYPIPTILKEHINLQIIPHRIMPLIIRRPLVVPRIRGSVQGVKFPRLYTSVVSVVRVDITRLLALLLSVEVFHL